MKVIFLSIAIAVSILPCYGRNVKQAKSEFNTVLDRKAGEKPLPYFQNHRGTGLKAWDFVETIDDMDFWDFEERTVRALMDGDVPDALRNFSKIRYRKQGHTVEFWALPDYLAVGTNEDYVRMPMGIISSRKVAKALDCVLTTTFLVDRINDVAEGALDIFPFRPLRGRNSLPIVFQDHNNAIKALYKAKGYHFGQFISGLKKDLVETSCLSKKAEYVNNIAIYGWHHPDGHPQQPIFLRHADFYSDYSHGTRLIWHEVTVDGKAFELEELMRDPEMFSLVSDEPDPVPAPKMRMLVGTYTNGNDSKGVYLYEFDSATLEAEFLDYACAVNPSFVIPTADHRFAYAVSETSDGNQGVYSFRITARTIDVLNCRTGSGDSPCNIVTAGGNVLTSDYGSGSLTVFPLLPDGRVGEKSMTFAPASEDGTASHVHCAVASPDGKYIFFTDLGSDAIYRATLCSHSNPVDFKQVYAFDRKQHPGPRHLVFSVDGRFAYLLGEPGDCVTVFAYENGELLHISTEPAYDGEGHGSADIHISPDGKFLYTSHRLKEDGISIFSIDREKGTLTKVGFCPTGKHPRNFAITPDGRYLLCACRDSGRIEIYSVDRNSGELSFTGKTVEIPSPVCIALY